MVVESLLKRLQETDDVLIHYFPLHSALADWGKPLESHLSEWIINHPQDAQDAWEKSFEAGCDFASTSTQACSPWRAGVFGLRDKVHELNFKSAKIAREVTPDDRYLAGFVSTTNPDFLEPHGNMTRKEVKEGYKEQISALIEGEVDVIMIVGNQALAAAIAVEVTKELAQIPVIVQNVFYIGQKGYRTMMGYDPQTASKIVIDAGADVIGASCGLMKDGAAAYGQTHYYEAATSLVRLLREAHDRFISFQPNAGLALLDDNGKTVYPASPEEFAQEVPNWIRAGARIVGGCCGTSLKHYEAISKMVKK